VKAKALWFWVAVLAQVLALFGLIGVHSYTLTSGRSVLLKTEPLDPWDPFRGQYVTLNYTISSLREGTIAMSGAPYRRGQQIWVTLREGDPYWSAVGVSAVRPAVAGGEVALRGTVEWTGPDWRIEPPAQPGGAQPPSVVQIRYGIEQFYVPEGEGPGLEDRQIQLSVEAKVDRFGRAALYKVFRDGKEINWK